MLRAVWRVGLPGPSWGLKRTSPVQEGPEGGPGSPCCLRGPASLWRQACSLGQALSRACEDARTWAFGWPSQGRAGPQCVHRLHRRPRTERGDVTGRARWRSALPRERVFREMSSREGLCEGLQTGSECV